MKKNKNSNFSKAAATYEQYADIQKQTAEILLEKIKINSQNVKNILDIGCGTGTYSRMLAKKFKSSEIYAFDISEQMIEIAKKNSDNKQINYFLEDAENINLAQNPSIKNKKFDLITSNSCIQWLKNPKQIFHIFKEIILEDGYIVLSVFGPKTFLELADSIKKSNINTTIPSSDFKTKEDYENIFQNKNINITEKIIKKDYPDLISLIKTIKKTGTQGIKKGNKIQEIWTKNMFKKIEEEYLKNFGKITVTYHLIFCEIKDSK